MMINFIILIVLLEALALKITYGQGKTFSIKLLQSLVNLISIIVTQNRC